MKPEHRAAVTNPATHSRSFRRLMTARPWLAAWGPQTQFPLQSGSVAMPTPYPGPVQGARFVDSKPDSPLTRHPRLPLAFRRGGKPSSPGPRYQDTGTPTKSLVITQRTDSRVWCDPCQRIDEGRRSHRCKLIAFVDMPKPVHRLVLSSRPTFKSEVFLKSFKQPLLSKKPVRPENVEHQSRPAPTAARYEGSTQAQVQIAWTAQKANDGAQDSRTEPVRGKPAPWSPCK